MAEFAPNVMPEKNVAKPASLQLVSPENLIERAERIYNSIASRAFELFEKNGHTLGQDLDNWLKAEAELLHPVHVSITDAADGVTIRAEVPGFTAEQLQVSVEPRRVTLSGKRETKGEKKHGGTVYQESCSNQILRLIDLPAAVKPGKVSAGLHNGVLELKMPKADTPAKVPIQVKSANQDPEC
jgi:HSP20 family protein